MKNRAEWLTFGVFVIAVLRSAAGRGKILGAIIADVAFGRSLIPNARRCLDSGGGYANDVPAQAGGSVFLR